MWTFIFMHCVPGWMIRCRVKWVNDLYIWIAARAYWEEDEGP